MDIENHTTKDVCHLKYDAYNYFGRDTPRKVLAVFFFSQLFAWPFWLLWGEGEEMGGSFVISVIIHYSCQSVSQHIVVVLRMSL